MIMFVKKTLKTRKMKFIWIFCIHFRKTKLHGHPCKQTRYGWLLSTWVSVMFV